MKPLVMTLSYPSDTDGYCGQLLSLVPSLACFGLLWFLDQPSQTAPPTPLIVPHCAMGMSSISQRLRSVGCQATNNQARQRAALCLLLQGVGEPVKSLIQALARGGAGRLGVDETTNRPRAGAQT
jgi:hypothetical protein